MSLMGSLYLGVSGLQTSHNALNTTAHNMSNLDTEGYTRQQVALATKGYNTISKSSTVSWQQLGLGVNYTQTRQVRDYFLDLNYRRESGRNAFYEVSYNAMQEIEDILGESNEGHAFSEAISNLWTSVQELSKDPTSAVNQNLFVTRSYEFITKASAVYESLCDYQDNMNVSVKNDVDKINQYAQAIEALNEQIVGIEAGDVEKANDLRDQRNYYLDELGKMGNISYSENDLGYVSVKFEGVDLVKGGLVNTMSLYEDPETGFYTPYWEMFATYTYDAEGHKVLTEESLDAAKVYDLTRTIASDLNTDIGSLKGLLLARGDHRATALEIKDINTDGEYEEGWYDTHISQSIIMNIEAEFDQLINAVTTKINGILADAAEKESAQYPNSTYLRDDNGNPIQLFTKIIDEQKSVTLADGTVVETGWNVNNLEVNMDLRQNPSLLGFRLSDSAEDNATMEAMKKAFQETIYTLNPNVQTPVCFNDYYKNLVAQVANSGSVFAAIQESQTVTVDSLSSAREQIVGVSSDEELTNMIMYQNAYNASSRYINVISEMLEHILTTLGR
ncbi:MAG: flagellar hook-associated protein FlgK [Lachnospiraceae bacterium]|nr:flagellar hook-associated protein FlgK [Lachnospiraceae bacterium]